MKFYLMFLLLLGLIYLSESSEAKAQNLEDKFQQRYLWNLLTPIMWHPTPIGPFPDDTYRRRPLWPNLNQMPISKLYKSVGITKMMKND
ncbi:hypothetical protein M8J77_011091 [Diaphorina citri]|nr:hypothetical protein M8J77_011091 [Diaphorina citri]